MLKGLGLLIVCSVLSYRGPLCYLVQFIVYMYSQEPEGIHHLYFLPLDGNRGWGLTALSEVNLQLLDLADIICISGGDSSEV